MEPECPEVQTLADYAAGKPAIAEKDRFESHLAGCTPCRETLARALEMEAERAPAAVPTRSRFLPRRWRPPAAAAAAVVLLFWGISLFQPGNRKLPGPDGGRKPFTAVPGSESLLADGSRVRLSEDARARALPLDSGERFHLFLEQGELEAGVGKGAGAFRISTPAGEIRVLGTRFRARVVPLGKGTAVCVDVYEGAVALKNSLGEVQLSAPVSGLSIEGSSPAKLEPGPKWEEILDRLSLRGH